MGNLDRKEFRQSEQWGTGMIPIKSVYSFLAGLRGAQSILLGDMFDKSTNIVADPTSLASLRNLDKAFRDMADIPACRPYISVRFWAGGQFDDLLVHLDENVRIRNDILQVVCMGWDDPRPFERYEAKHDLSNDAQAWLSPPKE